MTPLGVLILKAMRFGAQGSALFVTLVIGIEIWKAGGDVTALEPGFTIVLAVLLVAALWLARSIGRELARHGS
jgi:hypothetical protein